MDPSRKSLPNQPDPASGVVRVDEPVAESIGARLARQNKAVERLMKHPANAEGPPGKAWAKRAAELPYARQGEGFVRNPAAYEGMDDDETTRALVKRMTGLNYGGHPLRFDDLYRAYKHTPHQPASVFLKYLVHRVNNVDAYDDPVAAISSDIEFLKRHRAGGAGDKNAHVTGQDLHAWMKQHAGMPEALLTHKAALQTKFSRGVGLNIRSINGEPHVALTRGLNTDIMDHEHALSSWSDLVETGFGKVMHHAWVPMKDLWYSFRHGPVEAGGDAGHENEYLVAHTTPRYEAQPEDVKQGDRRYYENATDEELASQVGVADPVLGEGEPDPDAAQAIANTYALLRHKNAGPKTYAAVLKLYGDRMTEDDFAGTKHYTREQALASTAPSSMQNPNLAAGDLVSKVLQFSQAGQLGNGSDLPLKALEHPSATADTARALYSQYVPDGARENILEALARSPLTPPDLLSRVIDRYEQYAPGDAFYGIPTFVLANPNSTSEHADRIVRLNRAKGHYSIDASNFLSGRYSAGLINELSDRIAKGYGKEPLHTEYIHGTEDRNYRAAADKFARDKNVFASEYNALVKMGMNRHLDDDAIEALVEAAERHRMPEVLQGLAARQNAAPMSELSQLRVLRALDAASSTAAGGKTNHPDRERLATSKGLAPSTVWALALHPSVGTREALYNNKTVDPEVLAQAWGRPESTEEFIAKLRAEFPAVQPETNPYHHLARAIVDRRAYAKRRAESHLIKPWPVGLAKSESDWWPVKLREWMSGRAKEEAGRGYYYRASNLEEARSIVKDRVLTLTSTEDVLDGYVVFAHPARDYHYHSWEKDSAAGPALVYFETDDPPLAFDDRVYWPHEVHVSDARIAGIRPSNLQKAAFVEDEGLKGLYRQAAAKMHPDLATDDADRQHRTVAMQELNAAYQRRDHDAIRKMLGLAPAAAQPRTSGFMPNMGDVAGQRQAPPRDPARAAAAEARARAEDHDWVPRGQREGQDYRDPVRAADWAAAAAGTRRCDTCNGRGQRPRRHGGRGDVKCTMCNGTGRRPMRKSEDLFKGEPISRGPAFNGEKDYRPDESGDPKFPFLGGAKKEKSEPLPELPGTGDLEPGEHRTALAQLGHSEERELALAAACFLARRRFDADKFQQAMAVFNDDRRAALHAVDLADSEKNLQALEAVMKLQGKKARALAKSEPEPIGIHSIQPGNEDAVDAADAIERAVRGGFVQKLKLNGKHSKGAMAARDPKSGRVWLLKPGSGKQSPAAGTRDGTASQSRREACFYHIAEKVFLGGVIPRADLLIVNAQEWAGIKLLGADWKSLDERNREKQYKGREVLTPYLASGQLHRWAVLDYVLGNTDSHGQNLLVNEGGSVALIDHGAAFAGSKFDPAHDTKSFIPFYLRVWAPEADFKKLTPAERVKHMPVLAHYEDEVLKRWLVEDFTPEMVERIARKYGIDDPVIKACLERLQELRSAPGNLSRTLNALWAGAPVPKPDETR